MQFFVCVVSAIWASVVYAAGVAFIGAFIEQWISGAAAGWFGIVSGVVALGLIHKLINR